jgi:hypothetical protein
MSNQSYNHQQSKKQHQSMAEKDVKKASGRYDKDEKDEKKSGGSFHGNHKTK